jgi:hypothetical protein
MCGSGFGLEAIYRDTASNRDGRIGLLQAQKQSAKGTARVMNNDNDSTFRSRQTNEETNLYSSSATYITAH